MDRHIQIITGILMVMMINSSALARHEGEKAIEEIADSQTQRMEVSLKLSSDQSIHVREINLQFMKDLREAKEEKESENLLTEAKIMKSIIDRNQALVEVLTEAQMSDWLLHEADRLYVRNWRRMN